MVIFMATHDTFPEYRSMCAAACGAMTKEMEKEDCGDCEILGQWLSVVDNKGFVVFRAPDSKAAGSWAQNWVDICNCTVKPVVDDNQLRKIILGEDETPSFHATFYDKIGDEAPAGHSLFVIDWKFDINQRAEAFAAFGAMTEKDHQEDRGDVVLMGRYHSVGDCTGMVVCAAKSEYDLNKWAYNWCRMADIHITPVMSETEAKSMVKSKPNFAKNLAKAKAHGMFPCECD